jgi:hypothetical protein
VFLNDIYVTALFLNVKPLYCLMLDNFYNIIIVYYCWQTKHLVCACVDIVSAFKDRVINVNNLFWPKVLFSLVLFIYCYCYLFIDIFYRIKIRQLDTFVLVFLCMHVCNIVNCKCLLLYTARYLYMLIGDCYNYKHAVA